VGFDEESKRLPCILATEKTVTIECDIYFNKDKVLKPPVNTEVQIEGEMEKTHKSKPLRTSLKHLRLLQSTAMHLMMSKTCHIPSPVKRLIIHLILMKIHRMNITLLNNSNPTWKHCRI